MTTNKISFISKMFVVLIAYQGAVIMTEFTVVDFLYFIFVIGCFIRYIYISKITPEEE